MRAVLAQEQRGLIDGGAAPRGERRPLETRHGIHILEREGLKIRVPPRGAVVGNETQDGDHGPREISERGDVLEGAQRAVMDVAQMRQHLFRSDAFLVTADHRGGTRKHLLRAFEIREREKGGG